MSGNIPLAERLKRQRVEENESMVSLTREQLIDLRSGLNSILRQELDTMRSDMQQQLSAMGTEFQQHRNAVWLSVLKHRVFFPALSVVTVLTIIFLSGWGLSTWQESQIAENWDEIARQKTTLSALESHTAGLNIVKNEKGVFVVLPKGATTENGWTVGKQNAVRVTR